MKDFFKRVFGIDEDAEQEEDDEEEEVAAGNMGIARREATSTDYNSSLSAYSTSYWKLNW